MHQSKVDNYKFIIVLFVGLVLAMEGKVIASFIFNGSGVLIREWNITPYILCAFIASSFQYIRSKPWCIKTKMLNASFIGGGAVMLIHTTSSSPSVLVFAIQIFLVVCALSVLALEPTVRRKD